MSILDARTLFMLFAAPGEAVHRTIEASGWMGLVWPGNPDWEHHPEGTQLLALALHYFTMRHPDTPPLPLVIASQVLASHAVERFEGYAIEAEELYQQAQIWLLAFAGRGPASHDRAYAWGVPPDQEPQVVVPGGNVIAFTHAAVTMLETLCFDGPQPAWDLATHYLTQHADAASQRAAHLFRLVTLPTPDLDEASACADCGAQDLEVFYQGQRWGEKLCQSCFDKRSDAGQARLRQE
jgi:hypothetical protein